MTDRETAAAGSRVIRKSTAGNRTQGVLTGQINSATVVCCRVIRKGTVFHGHGAHITADGNGTAIVAGSVAIKSHLIQGEVCNINRGTGLGGCVILRGFININGTAVVGAVTTAGKEAVRHLEGGQCVSTAFNCRPVAIQEVNLFQLQTRCAAAQGDQGRSRTVGRGIQCLRGDINFNSDIRLIGRCRSELQRAIFDQEQLSQPPSAIGNIVFMTDFLGDHDLLGVGICNGISQLNDQIGTALDPNGM